MLDVKMIQQFRDPPNQILSSYHDAGDEQREAQPGHTHQLAGTN